MTFKCSYLHIYHLHHYLISKYRKIKSITILVKDEVKNPLEVELLKWYLWYYLYIYKHLLHKYAFTIALKYSPKLVAKQQFSSKLQFQEFPPPTTVPQERKCSDWHWGSASSTTGFIHKPAWNVSLSKVLTV